MADGWSGRTQRVGSAPRRQSYLSTEHRHWVDPGVLQADVGFERVEAFAATAGLCDQQHVAEQEQEPPLLLGALPAAAGVRRAPRMRRPQMERHNSPRAALKPPSSRHQAVSNATLKPKPTSVMTRVSTGPSMMKVRLTGLRMASVSSYNDDRFVFLSAVTFFFINNDGADIRLWRRSLGPSSSSSLIVRNSSCPRGKLSRIAAVLSSLFRLLLAALMAARGWWRQY